MLKKRYQHWTLIWTFFTELIFCGKNDALRRSLEVLSVHPLSSIPQNVLSPSANPAKRTLIMVSINTRQSEARETMQQADSAYLVQAGVLGLERLGKPKVLTLNNELEITQTKGLKRVPHYLERNTDADSSLCIGKGRKRQLSSWKMQFIH